MDQNQLMNKTKNRMLKTFRDAGLKITDQDENLAWEIVMLLHQISEHQRRQIVRKVSYKKYADQKRQFIEFADDLREEIEREGQDDLKLTLYSSGDDKIKNGLGNQSENDLKTDNKINESRTGYVMVRVKSSTYHRAKNIAKSRNLKPVEFISSMFDYTMDNLDQHIRGIILRYAGLDE